MYLKTLRCLYIDGFRGAQWLICLTISDFVPNHHHRQRDPRQAVQRGADMCFLVPRKRNHLWVQWAVCARLRDAGVGIYKHLMRLLHAETAMVDGIWATVSMEVVGWRVRRWL